MSRPAEELKKLVFKKQELREEQETQRKIWQESGARVKSISQELYKLTAEIDTKIAEL